MKQYEKSLKVVDDNLLWKNDNPGSRENPLCIIGVGNDNSCLAATGGRYNAKLNDDQADVNAPFNWYFAEYMNGDIRGLLFWTQMHIMTPVLGVYPTCSIKTEFNARDKNNKKILRA